MGTRTQGKVVTAVHKSAGHVIRTKCDSDLPRRDSVAAEYQQKLNRRFGEY